MIYILYIYITWAEIQWQLTKIRSEFRFQCKWKWNFLSTQKVFQFVCFKENSSVNLWFSCRFDQSDKTFALNVDNRHQHLSLFHWVPLSVLLRPWHGICPRKTKQNKTKTIVHLPHWKNRNLQIRSKKCNITESTYRAILRAFSLFGGSINVYPVVSNSNNSSTASAALQHNVDPDKNTLSEASVEPLIKAKGPIHLGL